MISLRALALVLPLTLIGCSPSPPPAFRSSEIRDVQWGGDVSLTAHNGQRVSTAAFRGRALLLFFGYTNCPDICAPTLTKLSAVRQALGEDAERVQVLMITVDPARDTPARLAAFVPKFDSSFIGLTGTSSEIAAVAREYKVAYVEPASAGKHRHHHIPHSGNVLVKDGKGSLRLLFREDTPVADMVHDLKLLLSRT
jgi:protein SCO1